MFWGVTLENDKRYTQTVEASYHLSMAALDPNPPSTVDVGKSSTVSLWLQHEKAEFLLCTLEYGKMYQQPLDFNFTEGEEVTFFMHGKGVIHLTGYLIEDLSMGEESMMTNPMMDSSEEDDDESEESEDIPVLVDAKEYAKGTTKRSKDMKAGNKKKIKMEGENDESSSEYSDSGDDDEDDEEDEDEEDDSSEEESSEDDSADSDHDKMTTEIKALKKTPDTKAKKNNSNSLNQKQNNEQKLSKKSKKNGKQDTSLQSVGDGEGTPILDDYVLADKKKKKKKKKQQKTTSESSNTSASNPKQDPGTSSDDPKSNTRVMASGLVVEDLHLGQGSEARVGRQAHVYYMGKLAKNGKMFDQCNSGKPFRFRIGAGDVISGWEKGLVGMRVGGKRRITIPAKLGYGSQQMGPIPPNSSLIFDIELKALS